MPTRERIYEIRDELLCDDIEMDGIVDTMTAWPEARIYDWFEAGGKPVETSNSSSSKGMPEVVGQSDGAVAQSTVPHVDAKSRERNAIALALGACLPFAPTPEVSLPEHALYGATSAPVDVSDDASSPPTGRVFCVSDLHTDHEVNLSWCKSLAASTTFEHDVLIVAGDVSGGHAILEETLRLLVGAFHRVYFTPGNHDLWVQNTPTGLSGTAPAGDAGTDAKLRNDTMACYSDCAQVHGRAVELSERCTFVGSRLSFRQ